jgi:hypothetical protein
VTKPKVDWDTVELVREVQDTTSERRLPRQHFRGPLALAVVHGDRRALVRRILAGASMKARAAGAVYTHVQICARLEPGLEVFTYGWGLTAAAMTLDFARSVDCAAYVVHEMSARLAARIARA